MIRIVLVDDNASTHQNTAKWLRRIQADITLLKAWDGRQALELIRTSQPHLLLTSLPMGCLSGFELLAGVAETAPELPTIVLSEAEESENSLSPNKVGRIGKYVFLRKPFDFSSLVAAMKLATEERPATANTLASFVRLLKNERQTCAVSVVSNEKQGFLLFNNGVLVDAAEGDAYGEPAVLSLLGCKNPSFKVGPLESVGPARYGVNVSDGFSGGRPGLRLPTITGSLPKFTPPQPPVEKWREYAGKTGRQDSLSLSAVLEPGQPEETPDKSEKPVLGGTETQKTAESILNFADTLLNGDADLDKIYELAPELKLRLDKGELPQQTASLLAFLDGQSTIREITKRIPNQASALRFLVSGLASTNLLRENTPEAALALKSPKEPPSQPPTPEPQTEPAELTDAPSEPIPDHPFFTPSDAILLAQTLSIRFGIPPKNASVALWGLTPTRQTVLTRSLRHLAATQNHHLKLAPETPATETGELARIPFRAGLSLSVHGYPSNPVAAQRIPELESFLATILFLDAERTVSTEVINRLWVEYSNRFDKPCLINLFNQAFDVQPSVIDHFARSLDLPPSLFGSWDISKPAEVADMFSRLVQVGMIF
jgi:CheY-like chemotaxis protein